MSALKTVPQRERRHRWAVGFDRVVLLDNEEDGMLTGEVSSSSTRVTIII